MNKYIIVNDRELLYISSKIEDKYKIIDDIKL